MMGTMYMALSLANLCSDVLSTLTSPHHRGLAMMIPSTWLRPVSFICLLLATILSTIDSRWCSDMMFAFGAHGFLVSPERLNESLQGERSDTRT